MKELIKIRANLLRVYHELLGTEIELPLTFLGKISNKTTAVKIYKVNFQTGTVTVKYGISEFEVSCFELAEYMVELYEQD